MGRRLATFASAPRAVFKLVYVIGTLGKPIFRVLLGYPVSGRLADACQRLPGAGLGRAQPGVALAEGPLDGAKGGRGGRPLQPARPAGLAAFGQPGPLVGGQGVEHDHSARP